MNSGSKVRFAVFASASDICRNGMRGLRFSGRGVRTSSTEKGHCAIVVPDFFTPYRDMLTRKRANIMSIIRHESALEPEHIDKIVIHGSLDDLTLLWSSGSVPDGISWMVNKNGPLEKAYETISRQEASSLMVVGHRFAPQAVGLMIKSWEERGEMIVPDGVTQIYPESERKSVRPVERIDSRR